MNFILWGIYVPFKNGLVAHLIERFALEGNAATALWVVGFVFCAIAAYLLGSINWAIVISRVFFRDDIRKHGSGNAGATNMLRTYGAGAAVPTLLLDGLKGVFGILIACLICGHQLTFVTATAAYMSAFFAILGHVFPCFYRFKGGKGVSSAALAIAVLNPFLFLILLVLFIGIVATTRFVSLGSVIGVALYPVLLFNFDILHLGTPPLFALLIAALIIWAHRANIKRIMDHTESKISFGKKPTPPAPEPEAEDDEEE